MTEYDNLLEEAKQKAAAFQSTAKKYIPRMYEALRKEDPHISPQEARKRIEKDCIGFWSKRTILEVLPPEAKNAEKQKAGRSRQNKHSSAAVSAAPEVAVAPLKEEAENKKLVIDTYGNVANHSKSIALNGETALPSKQPEGSGKDRKKEVFVSHISHLSAVSELVVLTSQASNACKPLKDHFLSLSEDGKNEYKAWIRQEMQRDANMINPITDLADIINDALDGGVED